MGDRDGREISRGARAYVFGMKRRTFVAGWGVVGVGLLGGVRGASASAGVRGEVVLVPLGKVDFPADLLDAVEEGLKDELQVSVRRLARQPMPKTAFYAKRRRWRADVLLDHLPTLVPDLKDTTRVLGLTTHDISTTKPPFPDWGIFGLGNMGGPAAVISSFRLRRKAKDAAQIEFRVVNTAIHEIGHTFGLDHCTEPRCPMLDAEGGITNTDTSSGHLAEGCRALLDRDFPVK
jgi:archaemetzincin